MSGIPYNLHITVEAYNPDKFDEITDLLGEHWPAWKHELPIEDTHALIDASGDGELPYGTSVRGFTEKLTQAIWDLNGKYCQVNVEFLKLEGHFPVNEVGDKRAYNAYVLKKRANEFVRVCPECGCEEFIARMQVYIGVIVDSENEFLRDEGDIMTNKRGEKLHVPLVTDSNPPYGPYVCRGCCAEYDGLDYLAVATDLVCNYHKDHAGWDDCSEGFLVEHGEPCATARRNKCRERFSIKEYFEMPEGSEDAS